MKKIIIGILIFISAFFFFIINCPLIYAMEQNSSFELKPVIISSSDNTVTLGLEYNIKGSIASRSLAAESDQLDPDVVIQSIIIDYSLSGTWTNNDKNPKNFTEAKITGDYFRSSSAVTSKLGLFYKYESNQTFTNSHSIYGLNAVIGKLGLLTKNDLFGAQIYLGEVNPGNDTQRKAVLGPDLQTYYRWEAEFLYIYNLGIDSLIIKNIEFNYRYFQENNPPSAIASAGLDRYQLATIRLGLDKDFFIAYCAGELPFNKKGEQIYQIGYSYKLK